MTDSKSVSITPHDEIVLAIVECKRMEEDSTQEIEAEIAAAAAQADPLPVVLDLSKLEFMPSLSLGTLVNLQRECRKRKQRFMITGLHGAVRSSFAITRLDKLFEICDSVDDALRLVRASA